VDDRDVVDDRDGSGDRDGDGDRDGGGDRVRGEVGAGGSETVGRVGHVRNGLDQAVGVHVRVAAARHAVRGALLVLGRRAARVTVRVLAPFVLGVVLRGRGRVVHRRGVHRDAPAGRRHRCREHL